MTLVTRNPHIINIWNVPFPSTFKLVIFLATYFQLIKFVSMNPKNVSNYNLESDNTHNVHLCIFDKLCWSVPVFCVISILKSCLVTLTIILYPNVFFVMTCSLGVRLFSSCVWSYAQMLLLSKTMDFILKQFVRFVWIWFCIPRSCVFVTFKEYWILNYFEKGWD